MLMIALLVSLVIDPAWTRVVNTIYGAVRGNEVTLDTGTVIESYWGVPYARPPVGELRFERPQTPAAWDDIKDATELPNQCIQDPAGLIWMTHPGWIKYSEDCLVVNIFAPQDTSGAPYAVMVWFHGGGYQGGGNVQYPGHFLAAKGVVVVTVNYRLAAFGFLSTPDGTVKGNMGLWDQFMSLRFVRDNIANFNGDPNRVTIFGQSAGAGSSSLQMVSPYSRGLFHRAILESGTESNVWSLTYPNQQPENYVYQTANKTNCLRDTDAEMVSCLKNRSALAIRLAQDITCTPGYFCQGFSPVVDGTDGFIPDIPLLLKEALGTAYTVPIISGICKDDGSLYTQAFIPEADDGGFNSTQFDYYLKTRLIDMFAAQLTQEEYDNIFESIRYNYVPWPYIDDLDGNRQAFNQLITDAAFGYPWDRQLKINSQYNSNTYAFVEAYRSPNASTFIPEWMGVPHMGELPYVWGYAHLLNNPAVRDDSGITFDIIGWTPEDIIYADYQMTLWANFAKFANPTPEPVKAPFNDTYTTWEKFSWDDKLKVFYLDTEISTKETYDQKDYAFFTDFISYLAGRPLKNTGEKSRNPVGNFQFDSAILRQDMNRRIREFLKSRNIDVDSLPVAE